MKKFLLCLYALAINFLIANVSLAENFYIKNYDVEMNVAQNKTLTITETIDVFFTESSHGIFRKIPTKNKVVRADDSTYTNYANIKVISVDDRFTTSYQNNYLVIKIGSPSELIDGDKRYTIKYEYTPSDDKLKENDELYFNIIGTEWDTNIEKSSFYIEMPFSFDTQNVGLSVGQYGTVGYNKEEAEIFSDGKIIEGNIKRVLNAKEGVTIRVLLPKNYFIVEKKSDILSIFIILILTSIIFILWYRYGKDTPVIPVVNFYPPEKRNSAEVSVEYKGSATDKAIVSLIIYLASKGYIRIDDTGNTYSLHKLKEYDGNNPVERGLMNALFGGYDYVLKEDLEKSSFFYEDCKRLKETLNRIKTKIFEKNATSWDKFTIIGLCISGIILTIFYTFNNNSLDFLGSSDMQTTGISFLILGTIIYIKVASTNITIRIITMLWTIIFIFAPIFNEVFSNFRNPEEHIIVGVLGLICLVISVICLVNMPKRTRLGTRNLGEILGFKKFIEVAEKNRIKKLLEENPAYCYDVLPYAYVLDVEEEWISKFETLLVEPPSWYTGHFSSRRFSRIMRSLEATTVPSVENGGIKQSSGSFSGGGGFSGGGCGGGGGGSW